MVTSRRSFIALAAAALCNACAPPSASRGAEAELAHLGQGIDDAVLIDETGAEVTWRALSRRPRAVFFGFTNCPEICPVTVWSLDDALNRLGAATDAVDIVFITIDPARDTPERLQTYFSGFGERVHGFTGSAEAIDRVAKAFEVVYARHDTGDGNYTMDHTSTVFLMDANGVVRDVVAYGSPQEVVATRLRALVEG